MDGERSQLARLVHVLWHGRHGHSGVVAHEHGVVTRHRHEKASPTKVAHCARVTTTTAAAAAAAASSTETVHENIAAATAAVDVTTAPTGIAATR